jgi:hypothetical protein
MLIDCTTTFILMSHNLANPQIWEVSNATERTECRDGGKLLPT